MDIFLSEPCRHSPPSCRFLELPHRSPPDDPMRYPGFLEFSLSDFGIIFLHADTPPSWEYLESCPELISLPYSLYDIVGILAIVVKKNSRSSAIVGEVSGDERAREGFHASVNARGDWMRDIEITLRDYHKHYRYFFNQSTSLYLISFQNHL